LLVHEEDRRLAQALATGDAAAFESFFNNFMPRLYRFALPRLGGVTMDAEDVVQQALIKATRNIDKYRGEAALFTWLCSICRNEIHDLARRERKGSVELRPLVDEDEVRQALELLADPGDWDPQQARSNQELSTLVHATLDHLPSRYGNVLECRYVQGEGINQIADRMGLGRAAADSLMARARRAFKQGFEEVVLAARNARLDDLLTG
jgi:RNA polymerase sigma-70 factor, ECF subfamily